MFFTLVVLLIVACLYCRSARIALVGTGEEKRYIIATQNMKPGDIIKTGTKLTDIPG